MNASNTLHPRNRHHGNYDFKQLSHALPRLKKHVIRNPKGIESIDFSDPLSVKLLNAALLKLHYDVVDWDIPDGYLCPPIPGRADYVHRLADLFSQSQGKKKKVKYLLDIGTGANCIYPLIAASQYQWNVVASDVETISINNAQKVLESNRQLKQKIELRQQKNKAHIFDGIIKPNDRFDLTMCNPPFHASKQQALEGSARKNSNLKLNQQSKGGLVRSRSQTHLNFGGKSNELWCNGGESAFVKIMADESKKFAEQVLWFSTLLSKKDHVRPLKKYLERLGTEQIKVVEMRQGQKVSRFVAWTFQNESQRAIWSQTQC